jgi:hypothetical protein
MPTTGWFSAVMTATALLAMLAVLAILMDKPR